MRFTRFEVFTLLSSAGIVTTTTYSLLTGKGFISFSPIPQGHQRFIPIKGLSLGSIRIR
uniref:Uncharacterized protein n=1 Tax=viral metagenome TaxID=1070528 RepID=A0A6C0BLX1_9ZZZZ